MFIFKKRKFKSGEIAPDEIFLDSSNLPGFDTQQFEGRIEKAISKNTIFYLGAFFLIILIIFLTKLFSLQIVNGSTYLSQSENNRLQHSVIFTERGVVYDRNGIEMVWNTINEDEGEEYARREYLKTPGSSLLLGYIGYPLKDKKGIYYETEISGKDGIEKVFDEMLKGQNGLKIVETDALMDVQSELIIQPPQKGENLTLTVDSEIQSIMYEEMKALAERVGFDGGAGVIMDVNSGEILSMVSYPEYNSNVMTNSDDNNQIANYVFDESNPFLNRVIDGLYTPGSVIKPIMAIGALNEGVIDPYKSILSTGSISIPNPYFPDKPTVFKDWKAHGWVDMRRAIAVSSDVYFYEIGGGFEDQKGIGIDNIEKYMEMFGFAQPTGINFLEEAIGVIPSPEWKQKVFDEDWLIGNTYHTSIGQYGFQTTPIQVVKAISAVANDGNLVTPILVSDGGRVEKEKIDISKDKFQVAREGMRDAVTEGTAQGLNVPFVKVAAKTGTAELGMTKKMVNSWITGFFPYENPKYAFVVIMERGPVENTVGGLYVMRQVLEWMNANRPEYFEK